MSISPSAPTASPVDPPTRGNPRRKPRLFALLALGLVLIGVAVFLRVSPGVREYQYKKATLAGLQSWATQAPDDALLHYYLGTAYHNAGVLPEALASFQRAAVLDKKLARAHVGIAAVRLKLGQLPDAQQAVRTAVELDPRSVDAQLLLGVITHAESKSKALLAFQKVTQLAPKNAEAWHWAGRCSRELNDFSGAVEPFRTAIRLEPSNGLYHRDLGAVLLDLGKLDEARTELEQALKLIPDDAETNYLLARNLVGTARSDDELRRAEQLMARSIELLDRGDPKNLAAVMVQRAEVLRQLKRPEEAYAIFVEARKLDPSHPRILHYMGLTSRELGNNAEAERLLAEYSRQSRQRKELSDMEQRVKQDMQNPALRLRLARMYAGVGNYPFAVNQYEMCLHLQPGNAEAKRERQVLVSKLKRAADGPSAVRTGGADPQSRQ